MAAGSWPVQDAKAKFSALLDASIERGPQIVTRRGVETAVLVSMEEWRRLEKSAPSSLKDWLLQPGAHLPPSFIPRRRWKLPRPLDLK